MAGTLKEEAVRLQSNMDRVYEAGKKSEYDRFWDLFQNNGEPAIYYYKFSYDGWTDENYNPKYPIVCKQSNSGGMSLFYANEQITDTKVPIIVQSNSAQSMFGNARNLVTVRSLTLHENANLTTIFVNCAKLVNLTIEGTIGNDINLQWSPLSVASMKSIISALKNFTGTGKEYSMTVTFSENRWTALEADSTAPTGTTWREYVGSLGWNA